jgi:hypothetical protein
MRSSRERGSRKKGGMVTRVRSWPGIRDLTARGGGGSRERGSGEEVRVDVREEGGA